MTKRLLIFILFITNLVQVNSQTCQNASVQLSAVVQETPPRITLEWIQDTSATRHFIYRKLKNGTSWGAVVGSVDGRDTTFTDTTVSVGIPYEYRVFRQATNYSGEGYIYSGIKAPLIEYRGNIIVLIDSTFADALSFEIDRLHDDLEGDGWRVIRHIVPRTMKVNVVKMLIQDAYSLDPVNTKTALLLGRIPVPYSGEINVDGHGDHTGAYPADAYYADVNGVWTDAAINNTTASDTRNHNVPEDGKFDQGVFPSDLELQLGRVDFFNMPSIGLTEEEMLRNYLDKDHEYRHKIYKPVHRALVDDNFGYFSGEAFAASGYKNAAPLVGIDNVFSTKYFPTLNDSSYLWSYGCGGGWYQGAGGVGTTNDFANGNVQTVFTMLFGSYFGDWDTPDNFLRAPLAKGRALTNVWSGRPHWQFHHMGLGEHIGYDVRLSQNNNGIYYFNFGARVVHTAFMGDPTLRNDIIAPVSNVVATANASNVDFSWNASAENVIGYHIYKKGSEDDMYQRLSSGPVTGLAYTDTCVAAGTYSYMVRALALTTSPSGTYYNLSQGISDTAISNADFEVIASADYEMIEGGIVIFHSTSIGANAVLWNFGDGTTSTESEPDHTFTDGEYTVTLIAYNGCDADTAYFTFNIITGYKTLDANKIFTLFPNPAHDIVRISFHDTDMSGMKMSLIAIDGKVLFEKSGLRQQEDINLVGIQSGIYFIKVSSEDSQAVRKLVIQ